MPFFIREMTPYLIFWQKIVFLKLLNTVVLTGSREKGQVSRLGHASYF